MDIHQQRVEDCTLEELLAEVAVRMQETNGMDFVSAELAGLVVAGIEDYRRETGFN